ncbi:succinylglutamate desuccinylase [Salinisphaera sp. Q1T1-3]|uniref:succinylglutamate desuccinylase n=1 Tax=Salinisphaera sp. Q1T1-3 TaxID=2321229 RepID=UPI000E732E63|nr:succinylglutamate desuccinylase [Salinisphaera sp. Q1T1-3]RJS91825.1 succinylglutamate desuccinylase [Salinisphaera sp. Q1T1-3]
MTTLRAVVDAAIADRATDHPTIRLIGGQAVARGPGLIALCPDEAAECGPATVISAGIHGNETAPLELVQRLADALDAGTLAVGAPALLVIGHPAAIVAGCRYLDTNLNRLFRRQRSVSVSAEHTRAEQLMACVDAFWAEQPMDAATLHLDLHTAIRESRYPRFAVEPAGAVVTPKAVWAALAGAGMQAVLSQTDDSWTFSHYSRFYHRRPAFTLELGRVAAFGANDLAALAPMQAWLAARIAGESAVTADVADMAFFRAGAELIRVSEDFELAFDDDVANFTAFPPGALLARDARAGPTHVSATPIHIVFPNADVELGARAALLAEAVSPPA